MGKFFLCERIARRWIPLSGFIYQNTLFSNWDCTSKTVLHLDTFLFLSNFLLFEFARKFVCLNLKSHRLMGGSSEARHFFEEAARKIGLFWVVLMNTWTALLHFPALFTCSKNTMCAKISLLVGRPQIKTFNDLHRSLICSTDTLPLFLIDIETLLLSHCWSNIRTLHSI